MSRFNLNVPRTQKDEAKALGARWDNTQKVWYVETARHDPYPFARWFPPGGPTVQARFLKVALIIDGNHLIRACNIGYKRGSDHFIEVVNQAISRSIQCLLDRGIMVGCIHFHQGTPLDQPSLQRLRRDALALGIDGEADIHRQQIAFHAISRMGGFTQAGNIPFRLVTGRTQYNGVRIESKAIGQYLESKAASTLSHDSLPGLMHMEIKQKEVDSRIAGEIMYFSKLEYPDAPNGFALIATDTDFIPMVDWAAQLLPDNARKYQTPADIIWLGLGSPFKQRCPFEAIRPGCWFFADVEGGAHD